jgi:hypothetical protein
MTVRSLKVAVFFALCFGVVTWPRAAGAQSAADSATAQALFDDARALMAKGNYDDACPKLEESQRLDPGSGTLLNLGDCYEHQGRIASAWTMFLEAAASARLTGNADRDRISRERAAALDDRLARLTIRVAENTAGLEVRRDGVVVRPAQWGTAIPADAGAHTIAATAPARQDWLTTVTLRDGVSETVVIPALSSRSLEPAKPTEAPKRGETPAIARDPSAQSGNALETMGAQRVAALAAGAVGVAGVAVGTVFGLQAKTLRDDAHTSHGCDDDSRCQTTQGVELIEQARRAGNLSTVAFVIGATGVVAGATLWITAPRHVPQVGLGIGGLHIRGTW